MQQADDLVLERVRCAAEHMSLHVDPAGTAPHWDAVLAVEIPGPWTRDICESEPFASGLPGASATMAGPDGRVWRPQGLLCDRDCDSRRVIAFERTTDGSGPFSRREWLISAADGAAMVDLVGALVAADDAAVAAHGRWRDDSPESTVDLLLCTHGARDRCCGGSGTALHGELVAALGGVDVPGPAGRRRIWRTSHTGGHRFAPTALSFPEGVAWAHLGLEGCMSIVDRAPAHVDLASHMRGALSVDEPAGQVADREGFSALGWDWLDSEREAVLVAHDRRNLTSTVDVMTAGLRGGDHGPITVTAEVALDRHIPMPTCGAVDEPEFSTEPVWRVQRCEVGPGMKSARRRRPETPSSQ